MSAPDPNDPRVVALRQELTDAPVAALPSQDAPPEDPSDPGPQPDGQGDGGRDGGRRFGSDRPHGEIFDDCPVAALGVEGDSSFYLDTLGQLRAVSNHTAQVILHLFGNRHGVLCSEFPSFNKDGEPVAGKFNAQQASMAMIAACTERGLFSSTSSIRGAGAWKDSDGNLIYHAGDRILIDGEWLRPGFYDGKLYPAFPPIPRPAIGDAHRDPAEAALELLSTWTWRRKDVDPQLMLGMVVAGMIGGALDWRPVGWLAGDAATGKSTLQKLLSYLHGGDGGLLQAADATEAGIRSILGTSSLPVALDEFEPDPDKPGKTKDVIGLARRAASGGQVFRGSADQKGYQSNAFSCFLFSSILIPHMPAQDLSRLITLNLDRIEGGTPPKLDPRSLRTMGAHLKRRMIEGWPLWSARLDLWRAALAEAGHAGRGADNYGTILAAADAALSPDALPTPEYLSAWARKMVQCIVDDGDDDTGSNAENMVLHLMGQQLDPWRRGQRYAVSDFVCAAAIIPGAPHSLQNMADGFQHRHDKARDANEVLGQVGLRVVDDGPDARLFFPSKVIPGLAALFEDSEWAKGVWYQAASRLPGAEKTSRTVNSISTRGVLVPLSTIPGLSMGSAEGRPNASPPPAPTHDVPTDFNC